jgi:hypothetical protein
MRVNVRIAQVHCRLRFLQHPPNEALQQTGDRFVRLGVTGFLQFPSDDYCFL